MPTPPELVPLRRGGVLSQLFFLWAWPTLKLGHTLGGALTCDHLPELRENERPEQVTAALFAAWQREQAAAKAKGRPPALIYALWTFYGPVKAVIAAASLGMTVRALPPPAARAPTARGRTLGLGSAAARAPDTPPAPLGRGGCPLALPLPTRALRPALLLRCSTLRSRSSCSSSSS